MQPNQPDGQSGNYVSVGSELYKGSEDYLRSIMEVYRRIGSLAMGNDQRKSLLWDIEYCTKCIINSIIDPDDRDAMNSAYQDILAIEYLKKVRDPTQYKNIDEIKKSLSDEQIVDAGIEACFVILGETRTYNDKYFGFEKKLGVMQRSGDTHANNPTIQLDQQKDEVEIEGGK